MYSIITRQLGKYGFISRGVILLLLLLLLLVSHVAGDDPSIPPPPRRDNDYPLDAASYLTGITFISTGLLLLFRGHKYNWAVIFFGGFYFTGVLILLFILKYQDVTSPSSKTRVVYFLLCFGAGLLSGAFFVCMWPIGRILVGVLGGLSLAMILLSSHTDGLIRVQLWRYIFMLIFVTLLALPSAFQRTYPYSAIIATVFTGCYLIILGTDIFLRSGLLAAFKLLWGFIPVSGYRYILDADTVIVLSTISFMGGSLGLGIQGYALWMEGPPKYSIRVQDEEGQSFSDTKPKDPLSPIWLYGKASIAKLFRTSK